MESKHIVSRAAGAIVLAALIAAGGAAGAQGSLPQLARLERGLWQLRDVESGRTVASICLGDPGALAQPRHVGSACRRSLVAQAPGMVEVRYTCPAAFGQTTIRIETSRLARVDSQGVDNGVPFGFRAEARHVGACR